MTPQPARTPESPVSPRRTLCAEATNRLLDAAEVADCLGVTARFVYEQAHAGHIPHIRLGRYVKFRAESIDEWIAANERGTLT